MNYRYPLLNLVTRGHLVVKNRIGTQKFIENLDNESCKTILESLLFVQNTNECSRILQDIQESYELQNNIRTRISDRVLNNERDKVLLREAIDLDQAQQDTKDNIDTIIKYFKIGIPSMAAVYLLRIPTEERLKIFNELKLRHNDLYNVLKTQPELKKILPDESGFFNRMAKTAWTRDSKYLTTGDKNYLSKIGKFTKNSALIAAGITTAIIGIGIAYKQLFSHEARKCNGLFGKKRSICMCNAIISASEVALKKSEDSLLKCDAAKDPQECRYKMKCEIRSWTNKIEEQKRKLARLEYVNSHPYPQRDSSTKTKPILVSPTSDPFGEKQRTSKPEPVIVPEEDPVKNDLDPFANTSNETDDFKQTSNPFG
jgi:hypothetical protein